jgi:4-amino-4-deoxy-L-arabinose transferase-like glycosyltransferase
LLFAASAAFVVWRNSQVGVLVDIAWIVNNATRIALGDVPYSQFPLAQTPGTFLVQAALIKLFGPHYIVQILYAAVLGGAATALTYVIAKRLLRDAVPEPRMLAAVLALPLIPLGIYAILPNPFYDPDACLAVLAGVAALLAARDRPTQRRWLVCGALLSVPLLIKQNIGGAYLVSVLGVLVAEAVQRPLARRGFRYVLTGLAVALGIELVVLQLVVGVDTFLQGIWTYALNGRGVSVDRFREFADPLVIWPGVLILILVLIGRAVSQRWRGPLFVAGLCTAPAATLFSPAAILSVPQLFPPLLLAAGALAVARTTREGVRFEAALPLVLGATALGALQSQGLGGSTYGIFPLLILAIATLVRDVAYFLPLPSRLASLAGVVLATLLTVSGAQYTVENVRLGFIDVNAAGPVVRSTFPSLAGLSARGPYVEDLDAVLFWIRDHVPAGESFAFVPGEEPAFFALNRKPALPSVYLYVGDIATPYTPAELAAFADRAGLRWVFVQDKLQLTGEPPQMREVVTRLTAHAALVTQIGSYRVYRR